MRSFDEEFDSFIGNRDWMSVENFWRNLFQKLRLDDSKKFLIPAFLSGDFDEINYGVSDLKSLFEAGLAGEFKSKDLRYVRRKTFAVRFGYLGTEYRGYERQKELAPPLITVEDDIRKILGGMNYSFSRAYAAGRTDKDVSALSQVICFSTTTTTTAPPEVEPDDILAAFEASDAFKAGRLIAFDCQRVPKMFNARSSAIWRRYVYLFPLCVTLTGEYDLDILHLNRILKMLENKELPYNAFAHREDRALGQGLQDRCTMFRASARVIDLSREAPDLVTATSVPVACVELIGSRFLRRMVRNIVATAVRESSASLTPPSERQDSLLVDLCLKGDRSLIAASAPGSALCLAGAGYDPLELAQYKFMPKEQMAELARRRTARAAGSEKGSEIA